MVSYEKKKRIYHNPCELNKGGHDFVVDFSFLFLRKSMKIYFTNEHIAGGPTESLALVSSLDNIILMGQKRPPQIVLS